MEFTLNATTNDGSKFNEDEDVLIVEFKIFCFIVYSLIFLLGMVGNALFCYVVISSRSMNSVTYRLLVNLSVSDLLITCLCGPVHVIHSIVMGYWPFGAFVCYFISYFQGITVLVSSYTLVVISFERYMSILYPLRSVMRRGYTRYIIICIWLGSAVASLPNVTQTRHELVNNITDHWVCTTEMDEAFHYYSLAFCILQYFLPVLLMTYSYLMVATTIWRQQGNITVQQNSHPSRNTRDLNLLNGRKKMIKMLIVVVVCYTMCWLPFNIFWVWGLFYQNLMGLVVAPYIFTVVHMMAVSHTCFNPFIYCWMNNRVRHGFLNVFGKLSFVRKCCFWIDWQNVALTRSATASQYHFDHHNCNRNSGRRMNNINGRPLNADRSPIVQQRSHVVTPNPNTLAIFNHYEPQSILATAKANDFERQKSRSNNIRQPKFSTASTSFEMAEILRQEPLLAYKNNRSQKFSVVSNSTQLTDISAILEVDKNNSGNNSPILLRSTSILPGNKTKIMQTLEEDEQLSHKEEDWHKVKLARSISEEIDGH